MRRTHRLLVVIVFLALGTTLARFAAAEPRGLAPAAAAACPVGQRLVVPAPYAGADGPASATAPFVPDPALVPAAADGRHARYQHWIAPELFPGVVSVTSLRFRIDAATPLADVAGDLTYAVQVAAGAGPLVAAELSPILEDNAGALGTRFAGTVTIAGASDDEIPPPPPPPSDVARGGAPIPAASDTVEIVFETPVFVDPAVGGLLIDLKIDGMFGDALPVLLDAAGDPGSVALFTTDETTSPTGEPLPAAPVLDLQYVHGEVLADVATVCLASLPLANSVRARLGRTLESAGRAADRDNLRAVARRLDTYRRLTERFASRGDIAPDVAAVLDTLGAEEAFALDAGLGMLRVLVGLALRSEYGLALFAVERTSTPFLPRGRAGREIRAQAQAVDAAVDVAFADAGNGVMATSDHEAMVEELCDLLEKARTAKKVDEELVRNYEDLKAAVEDKDLLLEMIDAIVALLDDTTLDKTDAANLKKLKKALKAIRKKTSEEGELRKGIDEFLVLICSLASVLDSGRLVSLKVDVVDGKLTFTFDVTEEIEIRIIELLGLDTMTDYGKTNIYFDLHVKKDATISFCPDGVDKFGNEQMTIDFEPPDGIDLDLDSSGIWVVHAIESEVGIPDLDKLCLDSIRLECGMVVFEGQSDTKTVKITADASEEAKKNPKASGVTVEVDGKQTFPK